MSKKNNNSNFSNTTPYNMYKKKNKYVQKVSISLGESLKTEPTTYTSLSSKDSLYRENRHLLKNPQFKFIVRKAARQLNVLMYINDKSFFHQLETNQSLQICLQSCLVSFPRRIYNRLQKYTQDVKPLEFNDQSYTVYSVLMKMVLIIYLRISRASDKQTKDIVYNQWLLDIPKLLDLVAIYGQSNSKIIYQIIQNTYKINNNYDEDTLTFFNLIQKGKLDQLEKRQMDDIDFSPESLLAKNFGSRQEFMMAQTMKYLYIMKDILFNLSNFMKHFPKKYVYELATDYKIQERLINGFAFFMYQVNNSWKLGNYKEKYFKLHFQDIRQSMVSYFLLEFQLLKRIIKQQQKEMKYLQEVAHNTYQTYCLLFASQKQKVYHIQYNKLINNLIEETSGIIFFLNGSKVIQSNQKTRKVIDFCQEYQKNYRSKHKLANNQKDVEDIYTKNRLNLDKFKIIWTQPQTKQIKIFKQKKEKQKKKFLPLQYQDYSYINRLKYGKINHNFDRQYDDQPQQQQFKGVQLENQYTKIQKQQTSNLDLSIAKDQQTQKKKYIQKSKALQNKNSSLSFCYDSISEDNNLSDFKISTDEQIQQQDKLSLSIMIQKQTSFIDIQKQIFSLSKDYEIAKRNEDKEEQFQIQFEWNDEDMFQSDIQYTFREELSISGVKKLQKQQDLDLSFK